jgi:addiction module HigA family antidote
MGIKQHKPLHPGEFIKNVYLDEFNLKINFVAKKLGVSPSTLSRLVQGKADIVPVMALKLSKVLGRSAESWLLMQDNYDLYIARMNEDLTMCESVEFAF